MLLTQNFKIALRALTANKMRSILTMLGIIIGVGAVVALLAIGSGATASITGQIEGIGSNLVSIMPGRVQMGMGSGGMGTASTSYLYYSDYEAVDRQISGVDSIAPAYQSSYTVKYNSESFRVSVTGVTADYFPVRAYEVENGRAINASDGNTQARVAVLGAQTAEDLFGNLSPLGKVIKINGVRFEVVGVLKSKGGSIQNSDDVVLVPLETGYEKLFGASAAQDGKKLLTAISMSASSSDGVDSVMAQAERILRREHRIDATEDPDFSVMSQSDFLSTLGSITTTLKIFLGAIAGISLLVGGIGIMNIMLVSVTERTKEIGLRKAVGARKDQILLQFLVETVTLSVLGGILGIAFGIGIAMLVTVLNLISAEITMSSILLAFFFAVVVGIFFGIYPAYRAASLHPIEALRYE
jgi:putative ABC transport system permease protein